MRKFTTLALLLMLAVSLMACKGGGTIDPPPVNFERMTANVVGQDGAPLPGLSVRVEGQNTGSTTDANGAFTLTAGAFPNGVTASNEISLGRNGVIVGSQLVVPVENPNLTITFEGGDPNLDTGSLSGNIFDEKTEELLDSVEITLFNNNGGVLMGKSVAGAYSFDTVPPGSWRISAYFDGYNPETAVVMLEAGQQVVQHLALTPDGSVGTGEGVIVRGVLRDMDTGAPVPDAFISMYADTGYLGMPEPMFFEDFEEWNSDGIVPMPGIGTETSPGSPVGGGGTPGVDPAAPPRESSCMPFYYDPQYQETLTNADGSFEFPEEVLGYSLWLDYNAEGYLNGNHYENIDGLTGVLNLDLEIEAYVETNITGKVVDENGIAIPGAYVEFIFSGTMGGYPMDIALPGTMDWEGMAEDGVNMRGDIGAPAPPPDANSGGGGDDFDSWDEAGAAMPTLQGMESNPGDDWFNDSNTDNQWMQRFRFEHQNADKGSSDAYFDGYYAMNADDDGNFSFENVPAGPYYVFASAYRHLPFDGEKTAEVDPLLNDFTFVLPNVPVGSVEGFVTDDRNEPVDDCLVNATQPFADPFTYTDATGYFRIDNIPIGEWLIGAYKQGFLTAAELTDIKDGAVVTVNLQVMVYEPPAQTMVTYTGHVVNGSDSSNVAGCEMVFTPVDNDMGSYYQHIQSGASGGFSVLLAPIDYNVLIQKEGYEDLFMRIWVDRQWPQMDFWLWPINSGGRGGPWGGIMELDGAVQPMAEGMPDMPPPPDIM